ncbi:MAG: cytochrome C oxidase subunit IV family protein [Bdellovibrionales bacterium]|nr:cytochrome C oxidase subunit IV family protein [Bdellovibrionales bacterium]
MSAHHVVPLKTFLKVFWALIGLTALTVVTAKGMDLHPFNGVVAFSIASVKGFLVMAFFMHLKYDDKANRYIIISSFFFVFLLFIFVVLDLGTRIPQASTL